MSIALRQFDLRDYVDSEEDEKSFFIDKAICALGNEMAFQAQYRPTSSGAVRIFKSLQSKRYAVDPWLEYIIAYEDQPASGVRQDEVEAALGYIKNTLSLNVSELAEVLGVTRPTIYAWADGGQADDANRQRLGAIKELAQAWESMCAEPLGSMVRDRNEGGVRIIDLLAAPELPVAEIKESFKLFAGLIETRLASQRTEGVSFRELAQNHGLQKLSDEKYRLNVKAAARRRRH